MEKKVAIGDLDPRDVSSIVQLVESTGAFRASEVDVARELLEEGASKGEASGYLFRVARDEERPLGYACYGPTPCTVGTYDLYWMAVAPQTYRGGVASRLLEEVVRDVNQRGGRLLVAETSDTPPYEAARAFYEARGFRKEAHIFHFYQPGDGKVIYVKPVSDLTGA